MLPPSIFVVLKVAAQIHSKAPILLAAEWVVALVHVFEEQLILLH